MRRKKAEEDARLEEVNRKSEETFNELMSLNGKGQELAKQRDDLLLMQVIAPDYRGGHIPELLMNYLFNGRAQTLSEAINVYHTEKHQQEMYMLAEQQRRDAQMAQQRQLDLAWQQMNMLRQQTEMQSEALKAAKEARDAAKNAELWSWISMLDNY
ncbi:MAG: hypothetical protein LUG55_12030 [Clostridiales bacterium]|nr:hypothetical protein [Clostridiales bacterium]